MLVRLFCTHRLLSVCTFSHIQKKHKYVLVQLSSSCSSSFSTTSQRFNSNTEDSPHPPDVSPKLTPAQTVALRRRRPLSPLERVSRLLPQDSLGSEVMQLREQSEDEQERDANHQEESSEAAQQEISRTLVPFDETDTPHVFPEEDQKLNTLPGESLLTYGEFLVGEHKKKRVQFKKMFRLQPGTQLQSSWGVIPHEDMAGQHAGRFFKTHLGLPIFIRRASLEDYVLLMKRGPAIIYPNDAAHMLMMLDVGKGDCVLEAGSGTGAMSLFLSRAVGSGGTVLSVEIREDHHRTAVRNYKRWRESWSLHRGQEWPNNVEFHNADLGTARSLLSGRAFHAVVLDMIKPHQVLPTVLPHLYPGAVCGVYLASISQVIDLLEGLRCFALPVICERIVEIPVRKWLVTPACRKDGKYHTKGLSNDEGDGGEEETDGEVVNREEATHPAFGSVPYVARPHPEQMSHTAFLVKLRKRTE